MPVHPAYAVNCSILLTHLPITQRPAAAKSAGFDAVEFWWPFETAAPGDHEIDDFVTAVSDSGTHLIGLNFFAGDMPSGDRGVLCNPKRTTEFRDSVPIALDIGHRLGCTKFNALHGNRMESISVDQQDDAAADNLVFAAQAAAEQHATVLLEALSGAPAYPLKTPNDVKRLIDRATQPNTAILADLFHWAMNGVDLPTAIADYGDLIGHVQIADAPGRGAPGTGNLDLRDLLAAIYDGGYDGWVGLEYQSTEADPFLWLTDEAWAKETA